MGGSANKKYDQRETKSAGTGEAAEDVERPKKSRGPGRPALSKKEKKEKKESRFDGPMRTTGRNKKQVNYANNGAGKTGMLICCLPKRKKIAKQKEKQRLNNQRQSTANQSVAEMPRAVVKWIECTKCGKWRKVGLNMTSTHCLTIGAAT